MIKETLLNFVNIFTNILLLFILIRIILSFLPGGIGKFRLFIFNVTEPLLGPIRRLIPPLGGVFDLSPLILFLVLEIIQELLNRFL